MLFHFTKMQGAGNDFAVFEASADAFPCDPATIRAIADRRAGIGCDQVLLVEPPRHAGSAAAYRVFNAAGGEVEQCGNGARCIALRVARRLGLTSGELRLDSRAGTVLARLAGDGLVSVDMGEPAFDPQSVPFVTGAKGPPYGVDAGGETLLVAVVSMGNPHAVVDVGAVDDAPVARIGAALQAHAAFPRGVNVGFVERLAADHIRLRVFERGVGETRACGTGACAAVAAGRLAGRLAAEVAVDLPGGRLMVSWAGPGAPAWLSGPAREVFEGRIEL